MVRGITRRIRSVGDAAGARLIFRRRGVVRVGTAPAPRFASVCRGCWKEGVDGGLFVDNWSVKARRRKTTGTGRMKYLRHVARRAKNGFREGTLAA